ncbi:MAG: type II toxin-antitoxin system death-on-curing family toxin [Caulobacterales bacterium]
MSEPHWLGAEALLIMHGEQLAEHGGGNGVRDRGLLESAIARPRNAYAYGERDILALAALYASGIVRNHPFVDGNKRIGFLAAYAFLAVNGLILEAEEGEVVAMTLGLAASEIGEAEYAAWLRDNVEPR